MNLIRAGLLTTLLPVVLPALVACGYREPVPPLWARDARFGRLGGSGEPPPKSAICGQWSSAVIARDGYAATHHSFPETNVRAACFTPVTHAGRDVRVGSIPPGCGYPDRAARDRLTALADELDALAANDAPSSLFPCSLTTAQRRAAYRQNADALRTLATVESDYAYAADLHALGAQALDGEAATIARERSEAARATLAATTGKEAGQ